MSGTAAAAVEMTVHIELDSEAHIVRDVGRFLSQIADIASSAAVGELLTHIGACMSQGADAAIADAATRGAIL